MTQTITRNPAADPTRVLWAKGGVEWVNDSQSSSIHGQWRWWSGRAGWRLHGYDGAGRVVAVWDERVGSDCVARGYTYDVDSNRTQSRHWPSQADGACPPQTTPTTTSHSYDGADRLLPTGGNAGLAYDAFGRTTPLPASAAGGTAATLGYHVTDMVATQSQGSATRSWTLDPAGRPRYITGLDGNLLAEVTHTGATTSARWQLVNLHGDVVTSAADIVTLSTPDGPTLDTDEYGNPLGGTTARYSWLGGKQRSTDSLAGLVAGGAALEREVPARVRTRAAPRERSHCFPRCRGPHPARRPGAHRVRGSRAASSIPWL
jgi:hypothetical protein